MNMILFNINNRITYMDTSFSMHKLVISSQFHALLPFETDNSGIPWR